MCQVRVRSLVVLGVVAGLGLALLRVVGSDSPSVSSFLLCQPRKEERESVSEEQRQCGGQVQRVYLNPGQQVLLRYTGQLSKLMYFM